MAVGSLLVALVAGLTACVVFAATIRISQVTEGCGIMSAWLLDGLITVLLVLAVGFGAISVIGLLLFPDIRSRSFTGLRAGILATALVTGAGVCYGIFS